MSYNTNNTVNPYSSNNAINSYPPTGYPDHNGFNQQKQQQDHYEHVSRGNNHFQDENPHILTTILNFRIFRIFTRVIDQGSPLMIYSLMKIWATNVVALAIAAAFPILRLAYFLIVFKRIDPCGFLYLLAFVIALCLTPIPTSAKDSFIRDSSILIIMGGMFIFSLIPFKIRWYHNRPINYLNSKKTFEAPDYVTWTVPATGEQQRMELHEWAWEYYSVFKKACYICTAVYGTLFILEFVAKVALIESHLTIGQIIQDSLIIGFCVNIGVGIGILIILRFLLSRAERFFGEWKKQNGFQ